MQSPVQSAVMSNDATVDSAATVTMSSRHALDLLSMLGRSCKALCSTTAAGLCALFIFCYRVAFAVFNVLKLCIHDDKNVLDVRGGCGDRGNLESPSLGTLSVTGDRKTGASSRSLPVAAIDSTAALISMCTGSDAHIKPHHLLAVPSKSR